ncbi:MAG: hypothetical protein EB072_05405 [Betaproteobacteria bacterium]|jgi:hypothetical protein|nr:hypothetical protein [Betaproteobacteria bacterium]
MSLVMDSKTRAELSRTDPWEVRGAYVWVEKAKAHPSLSTVADAQLMAVTPLIAQIREDSGKPLGVALRTVSEARVRRILASDRQDIQDQLSKAVRLLRRSVGVIDLTETAIFWGERRRRQLAMEYFSVKVEEDV